MSEKENNYRERIKKIKETGGTEKKKEEKIILS